MKERTAAILGASAVLCVLAWRAPTVLSDIMFFVLLSVLALGSCT